MIKYDKKFLISMRNTPLAMTPPTPLLTNNVGNMFMYIPDYIFRPQYEDTEKLSQSDDGKQSPVIIRNKEDVSDVTKEVKVETLPINVNGVTIFSR